MKACLVDCNVLVLVDEWRLVDIEKRANLLARNHFFVVAASGAGTGGLSGGILNELADFLF